MTFLMGVLSPYVVIALVLGLYLIDRFYCQRGSVTSVSLRQCGVEGDMLKFAFDYRLKSVPMWSEVKYSLVDRKNPTTVISGKTRGLDFSRRGKNSEFLLFKKDIVKPGDWDLHIKVTTVSGRINPLYSLFPIVIFHSEPVSISNE